LVFLSARSALGLSADFFARPAFFAFGARQN